MPRLLTLAVALLIPLGVGCFAKSKPASAFVRDGNVSQIFADIAKQAGVTQPGFSFGATSSALDGKTKWDVKLRYCARPDQIDDVMRVMHAEFVRKLRESGAEPSGDVPPPGPAAVKEWSLAYTADTQAGTIRVTRNDGAAGGCLGPVRLEYQVEFVLEEAPKAAP